MQVVDLACVPSVPGAALAFASFDEDAGAPWPAAYTWLTRAEADYAGRLATVRRRSAWLAGRLAAKTAIARLIPSGGPAHEIEVLPASNGAPVVRGADPGGDAIAVSISHTRGLAAALAFERRVAVMGLDLEVVEQSLDPALLAFAFSTEERHAIDVAEDAAATHRRALSFWTAKEAALKAVGRGLRLPLDAVRLSWDARTIPVAASVRCAPDLHVSLRLTTIDAGGCVVSIAREAGR